MHVLKVPHTWQSDCRKGACECSFATSHEEARWLLGAQGFDPVLSPIRLGDASLSTLIAKAGTRPRTANIGLMPVERTYC